MQRWTRERLRGCFTIGDVVSHSPTHLKQLSPGGVDSVPNDNIHAGKYRPVVCDWLSDTEFARHSAKAWYLFRNPGLLSPVSNPTPGSVPVR